MNYLKIENRKERKGRYKGIIEHLEVIGGDLFREAVSEYITEGTLTEKSWGDAPSVALAQSGKTRIINDVGRNAHFCEAGYEEEKEPQVTVKHQKGKKNKKKQCQTFDHGERPVLTLFKTQETARESASERTQEGNGSNTIHQSRQRQNRNSKAKRHWEAMTESAFRKVQQPVTSHTVDLSKTTVPFVAGTSISQSHNVYLFLQQLVATQKHQKLVSGSGGGDTGEKSREEQQSVEVHDQGEITNELNTCEPPKEMAVTTRTNTTVAPHTDEKTLRFKSVLRNLYDEFTTMSKEYEKVMQAHSLKGSEKRHAMKELKKLDKLLRNKEDEIIVLISLYRELITVKQRLHRAEAEANQNGSHSSIELRYSRSTSHRLKFLLQQVKKFQEQLNK